MRCTTVKIALLAPMARASVAIAASVNAGARTRRRTACRISCIITSMGPAFPLDCARSRSRRSRAAAPHRSDSSKPINPASSRPQRAHRRGTPTSARRSTVARTSLPSPPRTHVAGMLETAESAIGRADASRPLQIELALARRPNQRVQPPCLGLNGTPALGGELKIAAPLVGRLRRFRRRDEALLLQPVQRLIQRAGARVETTAGLLFHVLSDRVAVSGTVAKRDEDVKREIGQRRPGAPLV